MEGMISGYQSCARIKNDGNKKERPRPSGSGSALGFAKENSSKKRRNASFSITNESQQTPPSTSVAKIFPRLRKRTPRPLKSLLGFQKGPFPSCKPRGASSLSKNQGTKRMRKEEKKRKNISMVKETESQENSKVDVVSSRRSRSTISARAYMACFIEQRKHIELASLEELISPWNQPDSIQKNQNGCEFSSKAVDNENNNQSNKDCNLDNQAGGLEDADTSADISKLDEPVLSNEKPVDAGLTCPPEQEEEISEIPEVSGSGKVELPLDVNVSQKRDGEVRDGTDGNPNCDSRETFRGYRIDQTGDAILRTARRCSGCSISYRHSSLTPYPTDTATRVLHCPACVRSKEEFSRFVEYWVPAQISNVQLEQYCEMLLSNGVLLCSTSKSGPVAALRDILINARKCCNHPYVADPYLPSLLSRYVQAMEYLDVGIKASGKLVLLDKLLHVLRKQKMRVLILFQSVGVCSDSTGDILDDYIRQRFGADSYERVDGGIASSRIIAALNKFNHMDQGRFVFLLENRACHHRIVLSSVDVVIIFGSDWNPFNDLRNLQKISLKSELEQVKVFRLYTPFTVEEKVLVSAKHGTTWDNKLQYVNSSTSQMLLMWGASYLMKKLDEFQNSSNTYISESDQKLTENVAQEFLTLLHFGKEKTVKSSCLITKVQVGLGGYGGDGLLCGESTLQFEPKELPHIFWSKLLDGKVPCWKYICVSSQRNRKRVQLNDQFKDDSGNAQKKKRRTLSTKKPGPVEGMASNKEGPRVAAFSSVPRNDCMESRETFNVEQDEERKLIDAQRSFHVKLKQEILGLSEVLELSGDIRVVIEIFLDYVINNYQLPREPATILQAFQLSVCWTSASLLKEKMDRNESLELSRRHLGYSCTKEEADCVYMLLQDLKKSFLATLESSKLIDSCKAPELLTNVLKVNHPSAKPLQPATTSEDVKAERTGAISRAACTSSKRFTSPKARDENRLNSFSDNPGETVNLEPPSEPKGNGIFQEYEARKASLEKAYQLEVAIVRLHHIGSKQIEKLELMEREHAKKLKELELAHLTAKNHILDGTESFLVQGDRNSFEGIAHLEEYTYETVPGQSTDPDARINHDVEKGDSESTGSTTQASGSKSSSKATSLQPEENDRADSRSTSRIAEGAPELLGGMESTRNHQGDVHYGNTCSGEVVDKEMSGEAGKDTMPGASRTLFGRQNAENIPSDDLLASRTSIDGGGQNQEQQDDMLEREVEAPVPCNSTSSDMEERNGLPPEPQNIMQQRELEAPDSRNTIPSDFSAAMQEPVVQPQASGDVSPSTGTFDCAVENQLLRDAITSQQMQIDMQVTCSSPMPSMQARSQSIAHSASGALGSSGGPLSSFSGPRSLPSQSFIQGSTGMPFLQESDPLENELEKIRKEEEHADRTYDELTLRLKSERDREIQEAVTQIRMKFDCKIKEAEAEYSLKKNELDFNINVVNMSKILALVFMQCEDVTSSSLPGEQTGVSPDLVLQFAMSSLARDLEGQSVSPSAHGLPSNTSRGSAVNLSRSQSIPPVAYSHNLFPATLPVNRVPPHFSGVTSRALMDPASLSRNLTAPNRTMPMRVGHPFTVEQARAPAPHLQHFRPPHLTAPNQTMPIRVGHPFTVEQARAPAPHLQHFRPPHLTAPNQTMPIRVGHPFTVEQARAPAPHLQHFRPPHAWPISPIQLQNLANRPANLAGNVSLLPTMRIANQVPPSVAVMTWVRNRYPGSRSSADFVGLPDED